MSLKSAYRVPHPIMRQQIRLDKELIAEDKLLVRFYLWHLTALIRIMRIRAQVSKRYVVAMKDDVLKEWFNLFALCRLF
jgi:hypothetical protein